jgi:Poxvirus A32 protein
MTELQIKVIPSEMRPPDKRILAMKHKDTLPVIPSNMLLLGRCGSGKSSCLYSLLTEGYVYQMGKGKKKHSVFDEAIIYLGTQDSVSAFEDIPIKNKIILHDFDEDDFEEYLEDLKQHQMEKIEKDQTPLNILICFDDFVGQNVIKRKNGKSSALERLMLTSRHECNATIIMCSQTYKNNGLANPTIRNNTNYYICYALARNDLEKIAEEHQGFYDKNELIDHFLNVYKTPHKFVMINYKVPEDKRYTEGFTKLLPAPRIMSNKLLSNIDRNEKAEEDPGEE